jgi:hypothetical protein
VTTDPSQLASWRSLRNLAAADSFPSLAQICDPKVGTLPDAIRRARLRKEQSLCFELKLATYLQAQCLADHIHLPSILRGMEVLDTITDERRLLGILRYFLRSRVPQIVSKSVLLLGRRCHRLDWVRHVMAEGDDRIRANLIESLWGRREPAEIGEILKDAVNDHHHRVSANAIYGLFTCGHKGYQPGIDQLISNKNPAFRHAAVWVIKSIAAEDVMPQLKRLILDPDAGVRRKAFGAIKAIQVRSPNAVVLPVPAEIPESPIPELPLEDRRKESPGESPSVNNDTSMVPGWRSDRHLANSEL